MRNSQREIFEAIAAERDNQNAKWGEGSIRDRSLAVGYTVLGEEVGEVARAILEGDAEGLRLELVQVAAVAVAILESLGDAAGGPHGR